MQFLSNGDVLLDTIEGRTTILISAFEWSVFVGVFVCVLRPMPSDLLD